MILSSNTLSGSALGATMGGGAGAVIPPEVVIDGTFQGALADWLYPNMLERERITLYGDNARAELIAVTPAGETPIYTLTDGPWGARRIPTIESGGDEQWRLEIAGDLADWDVLASVTKVRMRGAIDEEQVYEVLDRYNAMKPGRVYQIKMQAICNIDPS